MEVWHEELRVKSARTRSIQAGAPTTLTLPEWLGILGHFQSSCAYCGASYDVIEHIVSINNGGGTTADNVVPACYRCNSLKDRQGSTQSADAVEKVRRELACFLASHGPFHRPEEYISLQEAANALNVARITLHRYTQELSIIPLKFHSDRQKYLTLIDFERIKDTFKKKSS